jgi:hypothetical protein
MTLVWSKRTRYITISKFSKNRLFLKKVLFLEMSRDEKPSYPKKLTLSISLWKTIVESSS